MKECKIPGCTRPYMAKGFCSQHYSADWYARNKSEVLKNQAEKRKTQIYKDYIAVYGKKWYEIPENKKKVAEQHARNYMHPENRAKVLLRGSKQRAVKGGYKPINISLEDLTATFLLCRLVCAVPGCTNLDITADHNHETGKFRGWLCQAHNRGLGLLQDSRSDLLFLADYVVKQ